MYDINTWLKDRPIELEKHLQQLRGLDYSAHS